MAAGQPVTPAADLWGLGATLFAAVEGRPPYDVHGDPVSTITEVVDGEVPRLRGSGPVADVIAALMVKDPARRMPLEEVRQRLRPLIDDPDDPLYPGSPDAPTMEAAAITRPPAPRAAAAPLRHLVHPGPGGRAPARRAARRRSRAAAGPRAAPPHGAARGRLPVAVHGPRRRGRRGRGGGHAGRLGAHAVGRRAVAVDGAERHHGRAPTTPRPRALGFTIPVPTGWTRRPSADSVAFVSGNGTEDLTVTRVAKTEDAETVPGTEIVDPPAPSAGNTSRCPTAPTRARRGGGSCPARGTVWVITLTVPRSAAGSASEELFQSLAGGFSTTA